MTFTYAGALATDKEKVRFEIGDTTVNAGPRPDSSNYSDEEIAVILTEEGSVGRAAARLCEVLAREWSALAGSVKMADYSESLSDRAAYFAAQAADLRARYGESRPGMVQVDVMRVDGFSSNVGSGADE